MGGLHFRYYIQITDKISSSSWREDLLLGLTKSHSNRRLVSNWRHLNAHANGNGSSRSSLDVHSAVDEKNLQIGVSSIRRDCSCKRISRVENDQVADWRDEVTKMIVDQRFVNKHCQGKDGAGCQPNQFLDALQILYSNKELFIKLLQDPNSLLVKQIHDLESSQVKEPCQQARQKRMSTLNKPQNSNATQRIKPFESFDGSDLWSSSKPQSSNRIVVLRPGTVNVETSFDCPRPHSPNSFSSSAQNIRPSHFPFSCIKRKLRQVMRVRRQEQQWSRADGKKVKELEIAERNSPINAHTDTGKRLNSYLDLKKRDNIIKLNDSELCMGQETASFGGSCSKNTYNTSLGSSEKNILNMHVEGRKGPSQILECGIEECKQCKNSLGRSIPLPDLLSLPSLHRYCEHSCIPERMRDYSNYQTALRNRLGLPKEGENGSYELQLFGEDISIRNSVPGDNLYAHYDIPRDGRYEDSPTQNIDINNITGGSGSFLDLHPEIQTLPFSQDVVSSSLSSCQRTEDTVNMGNKVKHPNAESVVDHFIKDDVTNPPITIFQPDESPAQVMHDKFEDLIRLSFDTMNNLTSSKDILDYVREILQAFSLKWDELTLKISRDQLLDPSSTTFVELKELTRQLSGGTILHDRVIETFMQVYQNCGFPPTKDPNVQAYVLKKILIKEITQLVNLHFHPHPSPSTLEQLVEKDLERRGSWLNTQVDTEDIAIEVEKDVLENLVLEIASEMDIRTVIRCSEPMSTYWWDDKALWKDCLATIF
ncbi:hypothetical protein CR513_42624, partial [Mucuna pruriens]